MRQDDLRALAVARSLAPSATLQAALERAGFVQADPIRAPACAQDLILRHRAPGYRAGDLERAYVDLPVEEGYLYAYGFLARPLWRLAHPPRTAGLAVLERKVLDTVRALGRAHPRDLEAHHGRARRTNAWGGMSKATTIALERLHGRGLLRVVRREAGVRVYAPVEATNPLAAPADAARALVRAIVDVMAPASERTVRAFASRLRRRAPRAPHPLDALLEQGEVTRVVVDDVAYLVPHGAEPDDPPRVVRLLAPFDPVVWDRARFEHLWGWAYRFEAYTPVAKRVRGYYALPLLWRDRVIGWANAKVEQGALHVDVGYERVAPRERGFKAELAAELERLRVFLGASRLAR